MRQTLFYFPQEVGPLPVFGPGWLLLAWTLFAVAWLLWLTVRRRATREAVGLLPFLVSVALALYFLFPLLEVEGLGLPVRGYGVMLLLAVLLGIGAAAHRGRQVGIDQDRIYALAFWMFVLGIAGARLFFVIQFWSSFRKTNLLATLIEVLKFTEGGLVVYGSFIGATLAFAVISWRSRISVFALADVTVPSMVLGLAIGRIGCLLNGCCYGGVCDEGPIGITFPRYSAPESQIMSPAFHHQLSLGQLHGLRISSDRGELAEVTAVEPGSAAGEVGVVVGTKVRALNGVTRLEDVEHLLAVAGKELRLTNAAGDTTRIPLATIPSRSLPVQPAQIYATINGLLIFWVVWCFFPFRRREGEVAGFVLTVYPATRILLEWVRADEVGRLGTQLTISQLVSLLILALMLVYWLVLLQRPKRQAAT
jgi:phosphatidylglycerol:prolipoprotein diacylglycerol transferase